MLNVAKRAGDHDQRLEERSKVTPRGQTWGHLLDDAQGELIFHAPPSTPLVFVFLNPPELTAFLCGA